jgi:arabinofuranosyltransferase
VALLVAAAVLTVRFALQHAYSMYDDAYIYLTYAENFAQGCGLTFRCDDSAPVEGFTSPLYMGLLLLARAFTSDLETAALLIGMLGTLLSLWFAALTAAHAFARSLSAWVAAFAALAALALDDHVLLNSVIGLETALFSATVAYAFWAAVTDRRTSLAAGLSFALWARPEGVLFLLVPILMPWLWRSKVVWAAPLIALGILLAARLAYYGDLLPNTYYAKSGGTREHVVLGAEYIGDICDRIRRSCLRRCA